MFLKCHFCSTILINIIILTTVYVERRRKRYYELRSYATFKGETSRGDLRVSSKSTDKGTKESGPVEHRTLSAALKVHKHKNETLQYLDWD